MAIDLLELARQKYIRESSQDWVMQFNDDDDLNAAVDKEIDRMTNSELLNYIGALLP